MFKFPPHPTPPDLVPIWSRCPHTIGVWGSGEAFDGQSYHIGVWGRRTCRVLFRLDRSSKQLRSRCCQLFDDQLICHEIRRTFSQVELSAKSAEPKKQKCEYDDTEVVDLTPDGLQKFFTNAPGVGPFKAQFCVAFAAELCVRASSRYAAAAMLEKSWICGWGAGPTLDRLLQKGGEATKCLRDMLPTKQSESTFAGTKLTGTLFKWMCMIVTTSKLSRSHLGSSNLGSSEFDKQANECICGLSRRHGRTQVLLA